MVKSMKNRIKWKPVQLDAGVFTGDVHDLIGIDECTDYDLNDFPSNKKVLKRKAPLEEGTIATSSKRGSTSDEYIITTNTKPTKKKKRNKSNVLKEGVVLPSRSGCTDDSIVESIADDSICTNDCMSAWECYSLPQPLVQALSDQGFTQPTLIQAQTLAPAILGRRDILGAAETGSGKTLAFGLPILTGIINMKKDEGDEDKQKPLYALILTPTRELAVQVKNHLVAAAKYTGIRIAVVVGGMAAVKQERLLSKCPEIVVATPGRLWELIQLGNTHLLQVDNIKYLAIDETDRMIERGHFQELQLLLERLNADESKRKLRQNFVFSATLTLVHDLPKHLVTKKKIRNIKKIKDMTPEQKLQKMIDSLGISDPKVVDVTSGGGISGTLTECRITCPIDKKDCYVYYFLQKHPGRTLIFCNSIGCVRRLTTLLGMLGCNPLPLHASMQQRQRLKNLDKFKDDEKGVLIATDVAARGLDIPSVEHVLHYQIPRTSEGYVHRSGRTARAHKQGITVLIMEPSELSNYLKLCKTLGKTEDLPVFPVQDNYLQAVQERVNLACELDKLELQVRKATSESGWFQKAADEMDIIVDDFTLKYNVDEARVLKKRADVLRKQLSQLLSRPLFSQGYTGKYPLSTGDASESFIETKQKQETALEVFKTAFGKTSSSRVKPRPIFKLNKTNQKNSSIKSVKAGKVSKGAKKRKNNKKR